MGDGTVLNPGSGGDTIATEDMGAYKAPVSKLHTGAQGVDGGPVTLANPLPVYVATVNDGGFQVLAVVDDTSRLLLEQLVLVASDLRNAVTRI